MDHPSVVELQTQRDSILEQNTRLGDCRPGNLAQPHRKGASHRVIVPVPVRWVTARPGP